MMWQDAAGRDEVVQDGVTAAANDVFTVSTPRPTAPFLIGHDHKRRRV